MGLQGGNPNCVVETLLECSNLEDDFIGCWSVDECIWKFYGRRNQQCAGIEPPLVSGVLRRVDGVVPLAQKLHVP